MGKTNPLARPAVAAVLTCIDSISGQDGGSSKAWVSLTPDWNRAFPAGRLTMHGSMSQRELIKVDTACIDSVSTPK